MVYGMRIPLTPYMRITNRYFDRLSRERHLIRMCKRGKHSVRNITFKLSMHIFNGEFKPINQTWYRV